MNPSIGRPVVAHPGANTEAPPTPTRWEGMDVFFEVRLYVQEVAACNNDALVMVHLGTLRQKHGQPANDSHAAFRCRANNAPRVGDEIRVVVSQ